MRVRQLRLHKKPEVGVIRDLLATSSLSAADSERPPQEAAGHGHMLLKEPLRIGCS